MSWSASGAAWSSACGRHSPGCTPVTAALLDNPAGGQVRRLGNQPLVAPWRVSQRSDAPSALPTAGAAVPRARWPDGKQPVNFGPSAPPPWGEGPTSRGALPVAPSVHLIPAHAFVVFTLPCIYCKARPVNRKSIQCPRWPCFPLFAAQVRAPPRTGGRLAWPRFICVCASVRGRRTCSSFI